MKFYTLNIISGSTFEYIQTIYISESQTEKMIDGKKLLNDSDISVSVSSESKIIPDVFGDINLRPVVSQKTKNILQSLPDAEHIQFINTSLKNMYLINILNNIECFDWERSIYTTFSNPKAIKRISKISLHKEKINSRNIFKIAEYPYELIVSEKLKELFEKQNITGIEFTAI